MRDHLMALYDDPTAAEQAIHHLHGRVAGLRVCSAAPYPGIAEAEPTRKIGVLPWLAFFGGLIGLVGGTIMQRGIALHQGLMIGGKPMVSWPSYSVVTFELTMMGAGLVTFASIVLMTLHARRGLPREAVMAAADGKVVVLVPTADRSAAEVADLRRQLGAATEVRP